MSIHANNRPTFCGALAALLRAAFLLSLTVASASMLRAQDPTLRFGGQIPPEVDTIYERGLTWLAGAQTAEGKWEGSNNGPGVDGICLMAFLSSGDDPNYGRHAGTIRRAIRAIMKVQDATTGYYGNSMYHHGFAMLALSEAYGAVDEALLWEGAKAERTIGQSLDLGIRCAATSQKKNRWGGWRYSPDASDADTSVTGAILMGLFAARNAGLEVADETIAAAMEYMQRSTAKDGSVAYSGGIGGGGSVNLTAVSALVSAISRAKDTDQFRGCMQRLLENLENNDGGHYREYFRYYMAQALFQGDYEAWQKWNAATARAMQEQQGEDGSFSNGPYGTGMSLLALALNYRFLPIYER
jgi:hypothetical protein